jgi:hypothetical protein
VTKQVPIAERLADIKRRFQAMKDLVDPPLGPEALPLEIRAAVLEAIEQKVAVLGINRRAFSYDAVTVRLLPSAAAEKTALELAFADLDARVRDRLTELRCTIPPALKVTVSFVKKPPAGWTDGQQFAIDYATATAEATPAPQRPPSPPRLTVTVIKGAAEQSEYSLNRTVVMIGRTAEVRDTKGRTRRNHVAFDAQMSTVSRAHATVKYDSARAEYRLVDDGSARGTRVVRGEQIITVNRDPRGVRLQSDDEVRFGDAAVRVTIDARRAE